MEDKPSTVISTGSERDVLNEQQNAHPNRTEGNRSIIRYKSDKNRFFDSKWFTQMAKWIKTHLPGE